jgi:hypothetical protein
MGIAIEKKGKKGNEMKIKIRRWTYSIYTQKYKIDKSKRYQ